MMTGRQFKSIQPADIYYLKDHPEAIPTIARWIYNEWSFLYEGKSSHYVENFLQERLHKKKIPLTLVAFKGGKPVGTVSLKTYDMETRTDLSPWITSLYVVGRWRRRGIGASLMKAIEEKAANLGIRRLFLFTADPGLADRFYSRMGWKERERIRYQSYPVIIMEKDLQRSRR